MAFGRRRVHETLAMQRNAGIGEEQYDFHPGDRVMTSDGFPGKVTAMSSGPWAGTEDYEVVLDNGLGGGTYVSSQLRKIRDTVAVLHEAGEVLASIPVEAVTEHTADLDYPELGNILYERAPNENVKLAANKDDQATKPQDSQNDPGERMDQQDTPDDEPEEDDNNTDSESAEEPANEAGKPDEGDDDEGPPSIDEEKENNAPDVTPPSACSFCGSDSFDDPQMTGRGVRMRCTQCGGTMKSWGGQWEPEAPNSSQNQASGTADYRSGGAAGVANAPGANFKASSLDVEAGIINWIVDKIYDRVEQRQNHPLMGAEWAWNLADTQGQQHYDNNPAFCQSCNQTHPQSLHPNGLTIHGSLADDYDGDWNFHFTAAWKDVQEKARRIRKEGHVKIVAANNTFVVGEVQGEHHVYESQLNYIPGTKKVADWGCGCKWASYSWGRSAQWKRFEGRLCSHALALQYEANSRGMFGKEVQEDTSRPDWQKAHHPVTVQYERPTSRGDGGNINRRAVPPGNMRRTFSSLDKAASDWHEFDNNHAYRSGHIAGGSGDMQERERLDAKLESGTPLDAHEADFYTGHQHGLERARGYAEGNHRLKQMWEQAPEYNSVEHQVNMLGHELGREARFLHKDNSYFNLGLQHGGEFANSLDGPTQHTTGAAMERIGDLFQTDPASAGQYLNGFKTGHDDHFGKPRPGRMPWFAAALDTDGIYESPELLDLRHAPIYASVREMASQGEETPDIIEMMASFHVSREAAKEMLFEALHVDEDGIRRDGDEYATPDGDRFNHGTPDPTDDYEDSEFARANSRDLSDHDDDPRHQHHKTNDAREHAPHWGWGLPAGVPIEACPQCNGSGCGHCAGQGQVPSTQHSQSLSYETPDQTDDAGDVSSGISSAAMLHEAIEDFDYPEQHHVQEYDSKGRRMMDSPLSHSFPTREHAERYVGWLGRKHEEDFGTSMPEGKWLIHSPRPTVIEHEPRGYELPGRTIEGALAAPCETPGAQYSTQVHGDTAEISVKLPFDLPVNSASDADHLEAHMHNAMEEILAPYFVHTADYSSADPLAGVDDQNYYSPTNKSNSRNPASTGWATSQDPGDWGRSVITNNFGLTTDSALDAPTNVAGVALRAKDTGRLLMLQRSHKSENDPAAGTWEFPGGHHEDGDPTSLHAAVREFEEEVGHPFPEGGSVVHTWRSGPYRGHVVEVPSEDSLDFSQGRQIDNPDGDHHEQAAWWEPGHAKKNPALRKELRSAPWDDISKAATLRDDPDEVGALPSTDGAGGDDIFPGQTGGSSGDTSLPHASTDALHQAFLNSPGAQAMMADLGITKSAMKDFNYQEQQELINEGHDVRARNFTDLKIAGTHYEHINDEIDEKDLFI